MMGIDEAGHDKLARHLHRLYMRMPPHEIGDRTDVAEFPTRDHDAEIADRPLAQHHVLRRQQQFGSSELFTIEIRFHDWRSVQLKAIKARSVWLRQPRRSLHQQLRAASRRALLPTKSSIRHGGTGYSSGPP